MASILLHLPDGMPLFDPDPAATAERDVALVATWDSSVIGVVGWSGGGAAAVTTAADHPELQRLVIISTPFPEDPDGGSDLRGVACKTLLLFGSADPETGSRHGRLWQKSLPNARLEMVPKGGHDLLAPMWPRVLSHLGPRANPLRSPVAPTAAVQLRSSPAAAAKRAMGSTPSRGA